MIDEGQPASLVCPSDSSYWLRPWASLPVCALLVEALSHVRFRRHHLWQKYYAVSVLGLPWETVLLRWVGTWLRWFGFAYLVLLSLWRNIRGSARFWVFLFHVAGLLIPTFKSRVWAGCNCLVLASPILNTLALRPALGRPAADCIQQNGIALLLRHPKWRLGVSRAFERNSLHYRKT